MSRDARFAVFVAAGFMIAIASGQFWAYIASLAAVYSLACVSLVVVSGWSGQLNLHVAALGLGWGAYATYAMSTRLPLLLAILLAGVVTIPFSALVAVVAVRFRGLELAIATLAMGLIFERLLFRNLGQWLSAQTTSTTFGSSFVPVSRPSLAGLSFQGDRAFAVLCLVVFSAVVGVVLRVEAGRVRRVLSAIRDAELAAEVAGVPTLAWRIAAFTASVAIAATAGGLFASLKLGVSPESFGLDLSFMLLAAVIITGVRSVWGGVGAGIIAAFAPEVVRFGPLQILGGDRLLVVFAVAMIVTLWRRPDGLMGSGASSEFESSAPNPTPAPVATLRVPRHLREVVLRAEEVSVAFGGVQALRNVSVWVAASEICALIGANGAGKSTLFNVCSGVVAPDTGRVYLKSQDVTHMPPHRRVTGGLARTFQGVELFNSLTVAENLAVAGHGDPSSVLRLLGLDDIANRRPAELPFARMRLVELGLALMSEPAVLLVDEPSAGLDSNEREHLIAVLKSLRESGMSVLVVEHDLDFVMQLADWIYVLDTGEQLTSGTPATVRHNPDVIARYLGESLEVSDAAS